MADTYNVFEEFENTKEQAVCLANIGAIMKQKGDWNMASMCFEESTYLMSEEVKKPLKEKSSVVNEEY